LKQKGNNVLGSANESPRFLRRIHERHEQQAAEKRMAEEERNRLILLALDIALVSLKASQCLPNCRSSSKTKPKKDVWSRIGDFVFGDV